jgi:membrane protein required for colicin V production
LKGIDLAFILIALFGGYRGYRQGFLMELFSLLAIIFGILAGFKLMGTALILLSDRFEINEKILPYVAFAVVFLIVVIGTTLIGKILRASIDKSFLGRIDEAAGAFLGMMKSIFLVSVLLWISLSVNFALPDTWTTDSVLMPYVVQVAPVVTDWIGEMIPMFKGIFE